MNLDLAVREGRRAEGLPVKTFLCCELVAENGMTVGRPGWGKFLPGLAGLGG